MLRRYEVIKTSGHSKRSAEGDQSNGSRNIYKISSFDCDDAQLAVSKAYTTGYSPFPATCCAVLAVAFQRCFRSLQGFKSSFHGWLVQPADLNDRGF